MRGDQILKFGHAMTPQTAPQASTGDGWIDEFARDRHQVVSGQQKRPAQLHDDQFLCWAQRCVHHVGTMGTVHRTFAILPFPDRLSRDIVVPGQSSLGERGSLNFLTYQVGCASLAVQGLCHDIGNGLSLVSSVRKMCLALKKGHLLMGT